MPATAGRDMLFGILGLQMNYVSREQLLAAMNAWVLDKSKPLGEILVAQAALDPDDHAQLNKLVDQHIERHGQDARHSLAALSTVHATCDALAKIGDADVQDSLSALRERLSWGDAAIDRGLTPTHDQAMRYRIIRSHARGAIGEVSVARDTELHRDVALKEIQPHKDHRGNRLRFLQEAEITGGLEHPGIVPVYGLGQYADGRPYYAMRLVKGEHLGTAIAGLHEKQPVDFHGLTFRRLLQRFVDVCNTIAYAHSRGVLHRDIKPSNIMLGPYGETLIVDWGLAKIAGRQDSSIDSSEGVLQSSGPGNAAATVEGSAIGTPLYMSPEQALGRLELLSAASDVFSLGATLYHLIVGVPPHHGLELLDVLIRAQQGQFTPPSQVNPLVPQALEAICRKAMNPQPANRYASAQALAADVEHWLADEPVAAFADPMTVRLRRWMRHHRTLTTSGLLVGLTTMIALTLGLAAVEQKRQQVVDQRKLAERRFEQALQAFDEMVFGIQDMLAKHPGTLEARKELIAKARPGLEKLRREAESSRGVNRALMASYQRLGDVAFTLGDTATAQIEINEFHRLAKVLAEAAPHDAEAKRDVGVSYNKLGNVALRLNQLNEAMGYYKQQMQISQQLLAADPNYVKAKRDLGVSFNCLGNVSRRLNQLTEAFDYYRQYKEIAQQLADADPSKLSAQRDLSMAWQKLGHMALEQRHTAEALAHYQEALTIDHKVAVANPNSVEVQRDLSISHQTLGDVAMSLNRLTEALEHFRHSFAIDQKLVAAEPNSAQAQADASVSWERLGSVSLRMYKLADALAASEHALTINQKLAADDPNNPQAQSDVGSSLNKVGDVLIRMRQPAQALNRYQQALAINQKLVAANANNLQAQSDLVMAYLNISGAQRALGQYPEAAASLQKAIDVATAWKGPGNLDVDIDSIKAQLRLCQKMPSALADLDVASKQPAAEITDLLCERCRALARQGDLASCQLTTEALAARAGQDAEALYRVGCAWSVCCGAATPEQKQQAQQLGDQAIEWLKKAKAAGFKDPATAQLDGDLDPLRERADFKAWMQSLEAKNQ